MLAIAAAFSAGVAAVLALPSLGPAAVAALPALVAAFGVRRRPILAAALAGFAWTHALATGWMATALPCTRDREQQTVTGRVIAPALEREGRTDFDLDRIEGIAAGAGPARVRVAWYDAGSPPQPGERWRFDLRLRCRHGFVNAGAADRDLALLREHIDATGYVPSKGDAGRVGSTGGVAVERLRARVARAIEAAVPAGPSVPVLQGLAVGVRGSIPDRLWEAFSVTGIAHLIAISGLHVTGCAIVALALLRLAWRVPVVSRLRARLLFEGIVVTVITAAYAILAGGSLPALRTVAMVAVFATLRILRRSWPLHCTLAFAGLVLVAAQPLALSSAGFWLSFVATAALFAAATDGRGWRGHVTAFAKAQLAVTATLTPVLAVTFGRISAVAPLVNALAIPAFSFAVLPAVLAGTVIAAVDPAASGPVWRVLGTLLDRGWPILESVASWPWASIEPASQTTTLVAATAVALFAALMLPVAGLRIAAAAMLAAILCGRSESQPAGGFALTAIDVGQGLSVVVETAEHILVFDTGAKWPGGSSAARVSLLPWLRARGIHAIDRLIVSHDDQDHAGGAAELQRALPVRHTMASPGSGLDFEERCLRGGSWQWDRVTFRIVHPPSGVGGSDNDRSCALLVSGAGGRALLLADPESAAEDELRAQAIGADVVVVPHHGSRSSSSPGLIAASSPRLAIASAGYGNRWGMPDPAVVERWRAAGATVLVTAEEGAIRVGFAPEPAPIRVTTGRRESRRWWRPAAGARS